MSDWANNQTLALEPGASGAPVFSPSRPAAQPTCQAVAPPRSATPKRSAARSLFAPCTGSGSLLEAVTEAATRARAGDVVPPASACSSFDEDFEKTNNAERSFVKRWPQAMGAYGTTPPTYMVSYRPVGPEVGCRGRFARASVREARRTNLMKQDLTW